VSAGSKARRAHMTFKRTPGHQCLGKDRYRNQQAAERAIAQISGYARAYRCLICKYLHLTSKTKHTTTEGRA
jgi:hypothetical protein